MAARSSGSAGWFSNVDFEPRGVLHERSVAGAAEGLDPAADASSDRFKPGPGGWIADHQSGLGILDEIGELRQRVGGVQRQINRARPHACEIKRQSVRRLVDLDSDPVSRPNAETSERMSLSR